MYTHRLKAPPADIWWALHDPGVLERAIPYCRHLTQAGPAEYHITCEVSVLGCGFKVAGQARFLGEEPPGKTTLLLVGGTPPKGFRIQANLALDPEPGGGTLLRWSLGEGGSAPGGQARSMIEQFIKSIEQAALKRPGKG